jgi:hypothetical protein
MPLGIKYSRNTCSSPSHGLILVLSASLKSKLGYFFSFLKRKETHFNSFIHTHTHTQVLLNRGSTTPRTPCAVNCFSSRQPLYLKFMTAQSPLVPFSSKGSRVLGGDIKGAFKVGGRNSIQLC